MFKHRHTKADAYQSHFCVQQRRRSRKGRTHPRASAYTGVLVVFFLSFTTFSQSRHILKKGEIRDGISPKSIVSNGKGLFAAQNMMYRHTVTIYNANGRRLAKIRDEVNLKEFGFSEYTDETYKGGPVEAVFTKKGDYLWVSNYSMVGEGFENPGCDACNGSEFDPGFLYKISMKTFAIEKVVRVGSVPKFLAISDDETKLVVSNWSSGDISIVDLNSDTEVKRLKVGVHPRGIDISQDSKTAYVTIMGSTKLAEVNLESYEVNYISDIGRSPRSVILSDHDSTLYVSLNSGSSVVKYNRYTAEKTKCKTAAGPRSMCLTPQEDLLYVVNYFDNSFSKIETKSMQVVEKVFTSEKPIGICGNWTDSEIWVACYSGKIEIFKDFHLDSLRYGNSILGFDLSDFWAFTHLEKVPANKPESNVEKEEELSVNKTLDTVIKEYVSTQNEVVDVELKVSNVRPKKPQTAISKDRFLPNEVNTNYCNYHLIAGSFSVLENAEKRKAELIAKGYRAEIIQGKLNYVSAICYENREGAEKGINELKLSTGYSAWILKR